MFKSLSNFFLKERLLDHTSYIQTYMANKPTICTGFRVLN